LRHPIDIALWQAQHTSYRAITLALSLFASTVNQLLGLSIQAVSGKTVIKKQQSGRLRF
jgi:hypothetical protein